MSYTLPDFFLGASFFFNHGFSVGITFLAYPTVLMITAPFDSLSPPLLSSTSCFASKFSYGAFLIILVITVLQISGSALYKYSSLSLSFP